MTYTTITPWADGVKLNGADIATIKTKTDLIPQLKEYIAYESIPTGASFTPPQGTIIMQWIGSISDSLDIIDNGDRVVYDTVGMAGCAVIYCAGNYAKVKNTGGSTQYVMIRGVSIL